MADWIHSIFGVFCNGIRLLHIRVNVLWTNIIGNVSVKILQTVTSYFKQNSISDYLFD